MTEPRICYYFLKLAVGRIFLLLVIIFIVLLIYAIKHISAGGVTKSFYIASAVVRCFIYAVIILCIMNAVTAKLNPAGYGICYGVKASYSYVPAVSVLCTEDGYRTDKYGVPLYNSLDEYRKWFIDEHPEKAYPENPYKYTDEEIKQIACSYYNARSTEEAVDCIITPGTGVHATLTLKDSNGAELEEYKIDRDELEGSDHYGNYVYLKD